MAGSCTRRRKPPFGWQRRSISWLIAPITMSDRPTRRNIFAHTSLPYSQPPMTLSMCLSGPVTQSPMFLRPPDHHPECQHRNLLLSVDWCDLDSSCVGTDTTLPGYRHTPLYFVARSRRLVGSSLLVYLHTQNCSLTIFLDLGKIRTTILTLIFIHVIGHWTSKQRR
jgi:hypothetical protein